MLQRVDIAPARITDYEPYIGSVGITRLIDQAEPLRGKRILHLNATPYGGGVSELLRSSIAIQLGIGLDVEWRVISGNRNFFDVTKRFHNALQGAEYALTDEERETFMLQSAYNAQQFDDRYDVVVVHDPQPVALLNLHGRDGAIWVWRCHIDTSSPNQQVLDFLLPFIKEYDALVFTMAEFVPEALEGKPVHIIPPAIDPLSPKNLDLSTDICRRIMTWVGIDPARPVLTQVSRFDPWKDPLGVIRVYRMARAEVPGLQLALLGSMALDDPEAWDLMGQVQAEVGDDQEITVATNLTGIGNIEVNAFQRKSDVIIQKSIREGFGLIISEALWKGTPVVAGRTGGIPLQMQDGVGGYLVDPANDAAFAERIIRLFRYPHLRERLGPFGVDAVRRRFLITRFVSDELGMLAGLVTGAGQDELPS
jgi:trehalose synthase